MKSDTKQFTHRYDLIAVDKIELRDASLNRMQPMKKHITISDPKTIEEILKGLDRSKKSFLTDNRPNYRIIFYKNNNSLLDIGYQNFVDRPYVRVKYKGEEDEYTINSGLFTILQQFIIENQ